MARTPPVRTAGQRPFIAVVASVVLLGSVVLAFDEDRRPPSISADPEIVIQSDVADGGAVAVRVGPPTGSSVDGYITDRSRSMREATAGDIAVVSFAQLQTPADAIAAVGDDVEVLYVLLRVPLVTASPIAVAAAGDPVASVAAAIDLAVARLLQEEQAFLELLASDSLNNAEFEADAEQQADLLKTARTQIDEGAPLVHAVVVQGPLQQLQALQDAPMVRLVDPAPVATDAATSTFYGLVVSDEVTVRYGRNTIG
jgi:hypothetical protein